MSQALILSSYFKVQADLDEPGVSKNDTLEFYRRGVRDPAHATLTKVFLENKVDGLAEDNDAWDYDFLYITPKTHFLVFGEDGSETWVEV